MSSRTEREKRRGAIEELQALVEHMDSEVRALRTRADLIETGALYQLRGRLQLLEKQEVADEQA
jgi:hypothetical protein